MVKYSKIRPFQVRCQLDLCRHEVHYGCLREDKCFYAHSLVELKVWRMQKETGMFGEMLFFLFIVVPLLPCLNSLLKSATWDQSNHLQFGGVFHTAYSMDSNVNMIKSIEYATSYSKLARFLEEKLSKLLIIMRFFFFLGIKILGKKKYFKKKS